MNFTEKIISYIKFYTKIMEIVYDCKDTSLPIYKHFDNYKERYNFTSRTFQQVVRDMLELSPNWTKEHIDALYKIVVWEAKCSYENKIDTISRLPIRPTTLSNIKKDYNDTKMQYHESFFGIVGTGKYTTVGNNHDSMVIRKLFEEISNCSSRESIIQSVDIFCKKDLKGIGLGLFSPMLYSLKPNILPVMNSISNKIITLFIDEKYLDSSLPTTKLNEYLKNYYIMIDIEKNLNISPDRDKAILDSVLYSIYLPIKEKEEIYYFSDSAYYFYCINQDKYSIKDYETFMVENNFKNNEMTFINNVKSKYEDDLLVSYFCHLIKKMSEDDGGEKTITV